MKKDKQFKTTIGGQALIEGIMMRGPEKDAVVVRGKEGLTVEVSDRKVRSKRSVLAWPFIRGVVNFVDSMSVGTKALMRSADLSPEEEQENVKKSRLDAWLDRKMQDKKFQNTLMGIATALGLLMSIGLFFLLPGLIMSFFTDYIPSVIVRNLLEGAIRISILVGYLYLASRQKDVKRLFAYHGAEHKTIACYEAGLELTVENVRTQKRFHPRCGTSLLFVIMFLSILVFSVGEHLLLAAAPGLPLLGAALREDTVDARSVDLKRAAVLIGSEGRGLSEAALAACDQTIRIPMSERCESLNAAIAAATLLWEGYR